MVGSALLAAGGAVAQRDTAKKQAKAIKMQNDISAEEIRKAAGEQAGQLAREARVERARIRVAAAESGVGGLSFEQSLAQTLMNEGLNIGLVETQEEWDQRSREANANSQLAGIQIPTGLGIVAAGVQGYMGAGGTFGKTAKATKTPTAGGTRVDVSARPTNTRGLA